MKSFTMKSIVMRQQLSHQKQRFLDIHTSTLGLLLIGFLTVSFPMQSYAGKIYKWVDAEGNVHFGSQAPVGQETQEMNVNNQRPSGNKPQPKNSLSQTAKESPSATPASSQDPNANPQKNADICAKASKNLKTMKSQPRVRVENDNGDIKVIAEEEKAKLEEQMAKLVKEHC